MFHGNTKTVGSVFGVTIFLRSFRVSDVDQAKWPGHAKFFGALWDGDGPTCAAHHGTTGAAGTR